jgi:DNA polymerase-3 subunit beta
MKFSMQKNELVRALYRVQGIADRRANMPILAHVLIEASAGGVTLSATDNDMALCGTYDADVATPGRLTVHARQLYDVIKAVPTERVTLSGRDNHSIDISADKAKFHLVGSSAEEFPSLPEGEQTLTTQVPADTLLQLIDRTLFCVSSDENRHNLGGIFCEGGEDGKTWRMVSTDGHRLALCEQVLETDVALPEGGALVPKKGFLEARRVLADLGSTPVTMAFSSHSASLQAGAVTLFMRLIEGQFPNYRQVIPQGATKKAQIERQAFGEALKRVSLLSQGRAHGVRMLFGEDGLTLVAEDPDHGDAQELVPMQYEGEPLTIGFNARYVLDILALISEPEVVFEMSDDLSPGVIRPLGNPGFTAVVMPMRI